MEDNNSKQQTKMSRSYPWELVVGQEKAKAYVQTVLAKVLSDEDQGGIGLPHCWLITGSFVKNRLAFAQVLTAGLLCENSGSFAPGLSLEHGLAQEEISKPKAYKLAERINSTKDTASLSEICCGRCSTCKSLLAQIKEHNNPDLLFITTEGLNIPIAEVRRILPWGANRPQFGKYRVVLIHEVEKMLETSSNILLKALEEPPKHLIWILTAISKDNLLPTIRSRATKITLQVLGEEEIAKQIVEKHQVEQETALLYARLSQGNYELAESYALDKQLFATRRKLLELLIPTKNLGQNLAKAQEALKLINSQAKKSYEKDLEQYKHELYQKFQVSKKDTKEKQIKDRLKKFEEETKSRQKRYVMAMIDQLLDDLCSFFLDAIYLDKTNLDNIVSNQGKSNDLRSASKVKKKTSSLDVKQVQAAYLEGGRKIVNLDLIKLLSNFSQENTPKQLLKKIEIVVETKDRLRYNVNLSFSLDAMLAQLT